jgi:hypothetical protein
MDRGRLSVRRWPCSNTCPCSNTAGPCPNAAQTLDRTIGSYDAGRRLGRRRPSVLNTAGKRRVSYHSLARRLAVPGRLHRRQPQWKEVAISPAARRPCCRPAGHAAAAIMAAIRSRGPAAVGAAAAAACRQSSARRREFWRDVWRCDYNEHCVG